MTLTELITDAWYETGIYSPPDPIDAHHIAFGGRRLNGLIDSMKAERLTIYRWQRTGPFALVANTADYNIGLGSTWNTARPLWIDEAGLLDVVSGASPTPEYPLHVFTDAEWAKISSKAQTSTVPQGLWYDRSFASALGVGVIRVWPVPTLANQVVLYSPAAVEEFAITVAGLAATIYFPPGYREFLMYHLAIRLMPAFGREAAQTTIAMGSAAMGRIKDSNLRLNALRVDPALLGNSGPNYNPHTDSYGHSG